ncbi:MAG: PAS domain S-box protein [Polyangiaceae bacterium]|nr:PAS domain S-box protein [Polyangiaceae bacterium]
MATVCEALAFPGLDARVVLRRLLDIGSGHFRLPIAFVARARGDDFVIELTGTEADGAEGLEDLAGELGPPARLRGDVVVWCGLSREEGRAGDPNAAAQPHVVVPLSEGARTVAVLCFVSATTDEVRLGRGDVDFARLLGRLVESTRERGEVARKLAAELADLRAVVDAACDAIIVQDEEHGIVVFNPAAERIFGCVAAEAVGSRLDRFVPPRFRTAHARHIETIGRTGTSSRQMGAASVSALRADGREISCAISISSTVVDGRRLFSAIARPL